MDYFYTSAFDHVLEDMLKNLDSIVSATPAKPYRRSTANKPDNPFVPPVSYIKTQEDGTVVVRWADGEVTPVRCEEGEKFDIYTAFCAALAKRVYGSTSKVKKLIDSVSVDRINEKKDAEKKAREDERKERERLNHERKIRRLAKRLREEEEARALLATEKDLD